MPPLEEELPATPLLLPPPAVLVPADTPELPVPDVTATDVPEDPAALDVAAPDVAVPEVPPLEVIPVEVTAADEDPREEDAPAEDARLLEPGPLDATAELPLPVMPEDDDDELVSPSPVVLGHPASTATPRPHHTNVPVRFTRMSGDPHLAPHPMAPAATTVVLRTSRNALKAQPPQ